MLLGREWGRAAGGKAVAGCGEVAGGRVVARCGAVAGGRAAARCGEVAGGKVAAEGRVVAAGGMAVWLVRWTFRHVGGASGTLGEGEWLAWRSKS